VGRADVGVVDVAVDDVGAVGLGVEALGDGVGELAEVVERGGVVEFQRLGVGEADAAGEDGVDVEGERAHSGRESVGRVGWWGKDGWGYGRSFRRFGKPVLGGWIGDHGQF
jgi:hypothetical protein